MVLEKVWGRRFTLNDIPLMINGDDCTLIGPNSLYQEWKSRTAEVGLIESVGKSYFTDKFAMINSRCLTIKSVLVKDVCEEPRFDRLRFPPRYFYYIDQDVGYVNLGILVGRKKGSNVDCEVNVNEKVSDESAYAFWMSAADNFAQMNLRCKKLAVSLQEYMRSFKRYFDKIPLKLHLPLEQGGFGFPSESDSLQLIWPKNPFKSGRDPEVMLGEAYFCGGMASQFDDGVYPDFLAEARRVGKMQQKTARLTRELLTCEPEPKVRRSWVVTTR